MSLHHSPSTFILRAERLMWDVTRKEKTELLSSRLLFVKTLLSRALVQGHAEKQKYFYSCGKLVFQGSQQVLNASLFLPLCLKCTDLFK